MRLFPFFATDRQKDRHGLMGACMCTCMHTHIHVHAHAHARTQTHRAISKKVKAIAVENRLFYHSWIVPTL